MSFSIAGNGHRNSLWGDFLPWDRFYAREKSKRKQMKMSKFALILNVSLCSVVLAVSAQAAATRHAIHHKPAPKAAVPAPQDLLAFPGAMGESWVQWGRVPLQIPLILWALHYTKAPATKRFSAPQTGPGATS